MKKTIGDFILDSLDSQQLVKNLAWLKKQQHKGYLCDDCGQYYDECDIFDIDGDYLCVSCAPACASHADRDDRDLIREEEKKFHHKGGL